MITSYFSGTRNLIRYRLWISTILAFLLLSFSPANAMEVLETDKLRSVQAQGGFVFGVNLEIGAVDSNNQMALQLRDSDGIPSGEGGSSTEGVFQVRFNGSDSLMLSDFGTNTEAQFGVNFDENEGMVLDIIDARLDMTWSDVYLGDPPGLGSSSPDDSMGTLVLNQLNFDDSFFKVKVR